MTFMKNRYDYYLRMLGERIKNTRVASEMAQEELSKRTGVSIKTLSRLENGTSIQLDSFIKVLLALDLEDKIELLVPDQKERPTVYMEYLRKQKKLLRYKKSNKQENNKTFVWGDEK